MERVIDGVRYKIQRENFLIFDYEKIEKHLEEMAAQGWIFEGFNSLNYWEYRQGEPQKIKYAVTYVPDANTDGTLNEKQQEMDELCAISGWKRVASYDAAQIYCSTLENPVPVETDEWARLQAIKKSMRKGLCYNFLLVVIWGANLLLRGNMFLSNPIEVLSDPAAMLCMLLLAVLVIRWGLDIMMYNWWIKKSENIVANGGVCDGFEWIDDINDWIAPVVLIFTVATIYVFNSHWGTVLFFLLILGAFMYGGEWAKLRAIIKKTGEISRKRTVKIMVCYIIVFVCFFYSVAAGMMKPEPVEKSNIASAKETFIASYEAGKLKNIPVYYEKYEVKTESLQDWLFTKWLEYNVYGGYYERLSETETATWCAEEVYCLFNSKGKLRNDWVLVKDNKFVIVMFVEENITDENKKAVTEELGFI